MKKEACPLTVTFICSLDTDTGKRETERIQKKNSWAKTEWSANED